MGVQQKIIDKVNSIEDASILNEILRLVSSEQELDKEYSFSPEERRKVMEGMEGMEGIDDANNGKTYSQKESDEIVSKWLKERVR